MTISGFMIVKDVVCQGYPFLEAIVSALPVCDEFLISDGFSTDHTWDALQLLKTKYPGKIKLFQDKWVGKTNCGEVLADMTNKLKSRCSGDYCLNIQANEVLHEESVEELRKLPIFFPGVEIFSLPFYNLLGETLLWTVDFRRRLFKNRDFITSQGDAFDVYYDKRRLLLNPLKYLNYRLMGAGQKTYYLPKPFFRYRSLFPKNYLLKLRKKMEIVQNLDAANRLNKEAAYAEKLINSLKGHGVKTFWNGMQHYFDEVVYHGTTPSLHHQIPRFCIKELEEMPKIIAHLHCKWEYELRESLDALQLRAHEATDQTKINYNN